ncbi:MAG: hypothetical protein RLZZ262_1304 [Bacteroidota bacterium]|jgi:RNA polymerase sigma factor (sigma-70 family)
MTDHHIIDLLRNKQEHKALVHLYRYEHVVVKHVKANAGSSDEGKDIYQEALIILMRKVQEPNFQLTSALDTYLFGISKMLWRSALSKKKVVSQSPNATDWTAEEIIDLLEHEKLNLAERALQQVSELCQKIFKLYYVEKWSMKRIAEHVGHQGENTTKTMKYKCLEQARAWYSQQWEKEVRHA